MKATASAPCSTMRRVALWITWPGTVKSFTFTLKPVAVLKKTGSRSKNSVRSSWVSTVSSRPRTSVLVRAWIIWRLVVFPDRPGP